MTDDQNKKEQTGKTAENAEPKEKDRTKLLVITIAACAAVIIGTLLAVFFTQSRQTSAPVGETTVTETEQQAPETEPFPDSMFAQSVKRSSMFGKCEGKNVVIITVPSLCAELLSEQLTPNMEALKNDGAYFGNVTTSSFDPGDVSDVINTGIPAERWGNAVKAFDDIPGLGDLLHSKYGYTVCDLRYGDITASSSSALYGDALKALSENERSLVRWSEDECVYPYFSPDGELESALRIADGRIGEFVSALREKGLYDKTVIVLTGTGLSDTDSFGGLNVKKRITVPLIITGCEKYSDNKLGSHTDVLPTLLDLLGADHDLMFFTGIDLLTEERDAVYLQTMFERGSFVDQSRVVMADSTATAKFSTSYNIEKDRTGAATSSKSRMAESVRFYEELDLALSYGLPKLAADIGRDAAIRKYEMEKDKTEIKTQTNVQDKFPENESKDFYKNDVRLFNRATMLSANEFDGYFDGVIFKNDGLMLAPGRTEGTFISSDIELQRFGTLIASWNASSAGGTVEIAVSAKRDDGTYTDPYSWGIWSADQGVSASASRSDKDGKLDTDTLTLKKKCSAVRLIIKLKKTGDRSPVLYNVTLAVDGGKGALTKTPAARSVKLSVNKRYQMDVPKIGNIICSPTSLSMVLDYYGEKGVSEEKTAAGVYDNGENIYGNWSYNVAWAGELGYNAYVDIYDITALKWALSKDVPVVCSVKIKKGQLAGSGYPDYQTDGHLLCVIGYETVDGVDWLIVNDPARKQVEVRYLVSEFEQIWRSVVYIVQKRPERFTWRIGEGTEQDLLVIADYIPEGRYNRPGGNYKVKYIVIHNTGNYSQSADANAHRGYVKADGTQVSWHFTVDDHSIYKHLPEEERAWHAGDGREGRGNTYGIGIEVCVNHETDGTTKPSEYFHKTLDNTAQLVAELLYKYDLSIKAVTQHNHYSGKNCPQVIRESGLWEPFLENVKARYQAIVAERGAK